MDDLKWCYVCQQHKERSEFYKARGNKDGLQTRCIICQKECMKQSHAKHRDQKRAYDKKWYEEHKEYIREYGKKRRETTGDRDRQRFRQWYHTNPYAKEMHRVKEQQRRAKLRNAGGSHSAQDVKRQGECQKWKCWWCGKKCKGEYHIDHLVPLAKGGHNGPSNIVIACPNCNLSKHDKLPEDFCGRLL